MFNKSLEELFFLGFHLFWNLLTHGFTQGVCFKPGISAKGNSGQQHVVLVHEKSVGRIKVIFHTLIHVANKTRITFALNVLWDGFHRSRAIQGHHGVDVMNGGRTQFLQVTRHT